MVRFPRAPLFPCPVRRVYLYECTYEYVGTNAERFSAAARNIGSPSTHACMAACPENRKMAPRRRWCRTMGACVGGGTYIGRGINADIQLSCHRPSSKSATERRGTLIRIRDLGRETPGGGGLHSAPSARFRRRPCSRSCLFFARRSVLVCFSSLPFCGRLSPPSAHIWAWTRGWFGQEEGGWRQCCKTPEFTV